MIDFIIKVANHAAWSVSNKAHLGVLALDLSRFQWSWCIAAPLITTRVRNENP